MSKKQQDPTLYDMYRYEAEVRFRQKEKRLKELQSLSVTKLKKIADKDCDAERILCEKSLAEFGCRAWKHIDPAEFAREWHFDFICKGLEQVYKKKIKRLIINIPPGMSKSMTCSVLFPVWCWIKDPSRSLLTGSYSMDNAQRDTRKSRALINSEWFQSHWGSKFQFSDDQNQKQFYQNDKFGYRQAFSVMSRGTTGKRGDIVILDDPISAGDAFSKNARENVIMVLNQVLMTRVNDPKTSPVVLVMQRLHEQDPTGHFQNIGGWEKVSLPMKFEPNNRCETSFGKDKRKKDGELLSDRYDAETLRMLEKSLGSYGWAGQFQQRPVPLEGGIIKQAWFKYYDELPKISRYMWSWDMAVKDKEINDYSVGVLIGQSENGYYIVDMIRKKLEYPELKRTFLNAHQKYPSSCTIVEDKASGSPLIQELKRSTSIPIIPIEPGREVPKTKILKMNMSSPLFESGKVFLPKNAVWLMDFTDEMTSFPNGAHDDICDATSQALCYMLSKTNKIPMFGFM